MSMMHSVAAGLVLSVLTPSLSLGKPPQSASRGTVAATQDGEPQGESARRLAAIERELTERPDDLGLLKTYETEAVSQLVELNLRARRDPSASQPVRRLAEHVKRVLDGLRPTDAGAKQAVAEMAGTVDYHRRQADARQQTFEQLRQRLRARPDDVEAMLVYEIKVQAEHHPFNEPEETGAQLAGAREFLSALKEEATDETVRETIANLLAGTIPRLEKQIAESLALREALLGRDAPPLAGVQAWVNGGPLAEDELRGKVVLLEFWAVWCGPCIRLFPDLRQWHERYSGRGLKVVAVTGYHNYKWDEAANAPVESEADVPPADEVQMLEKFVRRHELPFPIAVEHGRAVSKAYRVDAVPRTVLIDRRGKIRLIHVGAGQTPQVEEMITKLLAEDAAAGGEGRPPG